MTTVGARIKAELQRIGELGVHVGTMYNDFMAEEAAINDFKAMAASKQKEIEACGAAIEAKTIRIGELGVEMVNMTDQEGPPKCCFHHSAAHVKHSSHEGAGFGTDPCGKHKR